MSITTFLHLEALEHAKNELANYERKLEEFVKADFEKVKAGLADAVQHFRVEIQRLRAAIDTRVLAHLDEGQHPQTAVKLAEASAPTQAETAAKILAEQAKV